MTDTRLRLAERLDRLNPWKEMDWPEVCRQAAAELRTPAAAEVEEWIRWCEAQADFLGLENLHDLAALLRRLSPASVEEGRRPIESAAREWAAARRAVSLHEGLKDVRVDNEFGKKLTRLSDAEHALVIAVHNLQAPPAAKPHVGTIAGKEEPR